MKLLDINNLNKYSISYLITYLCDLIEYENYLMYLDSKKSLSQKDLLFLRIRIFHIQSIKDEIKKNLESRGY